MSIDLLGMEIEACRQILREQGISFTEKYISTFKLSSPDCKCVVKTLEKDGGLVLYIADFKKNAGV